jgi:hypothetical protein
MSSKRRALEIDEDLHFQQKEWFFQRIGVGLLFLFVVAALLGFTGMGGPMSHGEAGEPGGSVHVEYERFVRRNAQATITVRLHGAPGDVRFWISSPYFEHVRVDSIVPAPQLVSVEAGRHMYVIRAASPDVTVALELEHLTAGRRDVEIGLVGGPSVRFSQLAIF